MSEKALKNLQRALKTDLTDYRAIPFWSWNTELDKEELLREIDEMKAAGVGGFIMHARIGLITEYLGEKWFDCVGACLKKAKKLGMRAWVYDENGWPSGFVGGKLLERTDFRAQFLRYAEKTEFDSEAFAVYYKHRGGFTRIEEARESVKKYYCVYRLVSPANTDILNPELVDTFIKETHEEYYKRFPKSFGHELAGFFTDEPQCYRAETPYSPFLAAELQKRYGIDARDGLIYLFNDDERGFEFRTRYYSVMNELYVNTFYKKLYDWCEAHHCKSTGHSIEEKYLDLQMWGGAGVSATYEYEHIPAIDWLGGGCNNEISQKQVASVAEQLGQKHVLTETFACCGHGATPRLLKSVGDFQYFNGVNQMCHHLFPHSISAQAKTDHPPVFSRHSNWFGQFGTFNEYFTRLGFLVANTEEQCDVLVIHPLRGMYLEYVRNAEKRTETAKQFDALVLELRKKGILWQCADETILEKYGRAEGDTLVVGKKPYKTVIVPDMKTLSASTLRLLEQYRGKLCLMGQISMADGVKAEVSLVSNTDMEAIEAARLYPFTAQDGHTQITARKSELGEYLFVKNLSNTEESRAEIKGLSKRFRKVDLETFTLEDVSDDLTLEPMGGVILVRDEKAKPAEKKEETTDVTKNFAVSAVTENFLLIDTARLSYDGKTFGEELPIMRIFEDLLRADYRGKITLSEKFTAKEKMPLTLIFEKNDRMKVFLNGEEVSHQTSAFDINFEEGDVTALVREGENEIRYEIDYFQHEGVHFALFDPLATESLRNCLYYDTYLEPCYVKGNFTVNEAREIAPKTQNPRVTDRLEKEGYPFFKGLVTYTGAVPYDGKKKVRLGVEGKYLVAEVKVNGKKTDYVLKTEKDITKLLKKGENRVEIILHSSLRNLFGPHHFKPDPDPQAVGPRNFTFRGEWKGGVAENFTPVYQSAPFGLEKVLLIEKEK